MAEFKAKADKESSSTEKKYSVFFGRWQPFHKGHYWLINERLNKVKTYGLLSEMLSQMKKILGQHKRF